MPMSGSAAKVGHQARLQELFLFHHVLKDIGGGGIKVDWAASGISLV